MVCGMEKKGARIPDHLSVEERGTMEGGEEQKAPKPTQTTEGRQEKPGKCKPRMGLESNVRGREF